MEQLTRGRRAREERRREKREKWMVSTCQQQDKIENEPLNMPQDHRFCGDRALQLLSCKFNFLLCACDFSVMYSVKPKKNIYIFISM